VTGLETEPAHLGDGLDDDQRIAVVVAAGARSYQAEALDLSQVVGLNSSSLNEFLT